MIGAVQQLQGQEGKRTLLPPSGASCPEVVPAQAVPALDTRRIRLFSSGGGLAQPTLHFAVSGVSSLLEVASEGALGMSVYELALLCLSPSGSSS